MAGLVDDLNLGETDAVLLEDSEGNRKQAARNRRIRGLLDERKRQAGPTLKAQGGFEELEKIGQSEVTELDMGPPPWFAIRDEQSVSLRLHEELLDFTAFIRPSAAEVAARRGWVAAIEAAARSLWASSEVQVFGSSSTGLCLPTADVDLALSGLGPSVHATTALKRLAERLLELGEVSKIEIVQSAKVPVMKLQQRSTGLMADVIVNRSDGLETSQFIREQMEVYPALLPLVLFLKLFLLQRGLAETFRGGMGSYLLVCVVLSFLQRHPSAKDAQMHARTTLGNLLFDFFRHYGQEFRYGVHGISVSKGGSLFDRSSRGWTATDRNGRPTLCVESPLDTTVDIGSKCFKIGVVRAAFNHAYHVLGEYFVKREAPGHSLLCPGLLRTGHPVIVGRHQILQEQPPPLLAEAQGVEEDEDEDEGDAPLKRRKLLAATPLGVAEGVVAKQVKGHATTLNPVMPVTPPDSLSAALAAPDHKEEEEEAEEEEQELDITIDGVAAEDPHDAYEMVDVNESAGVVQDEEALIAATAEPDRLVSPEESYDLAALDAELGDLLVPQADGVEQLATDAYEAVVADEASLEGPAPALAEDYIAFS